MLLSLYGTLNLNRKGARARLAAATCVSGRDSSHTQVIWPTLRRASDETCCRRRWLDYSFTPRLVIPRPYEPSERLQGREQPERHHGPQRRGCPEAGEWEKGLYAMRPSAKVFPPVLSLLPSSRASYSRAINIFTIIYRYTRRHLPVSSSNLLEEGVTRVS